MSAEWADQDILSLSHMRKVKVIPWLHGQNDDKI